jgi:tetratricopeptide (TPR) repeat protein
MKDDATERIERMAHQNRQAVNLAQLLSFAVLIEPALLRAVRLEIMPRVDVSAEADLWFGPLVETRNRDGIVLLPRVAEKLREDIKDELAERSWRITERLHDYLPPALRLEEKLNWLSTNPTGNSGEISKLLQSALNALIVQARDDIANWAGRALPRLPQSVRGTQSAAMLAAASDLRLGRTWTLTEHLRGPRIPDWFSDIVPTDLAGVEVGIGISDLGLTFDPTPPLDAQRISLPATDPLVIQVSTQGESMVVFLDAKTARSVPIFLDNGSVELTTIAGEAFTLEDEAIARNYREITLSSTFVDLKEHRQRTINAIIRCGYRPRIAQDSATLSDADVIETSLNMIRDSAAYIGVIGWKYGRTPIDPHRNPNRLSISELEFDEALRLDRPMALFVMGDEHPVKSADVETDPDKKKKLDEFRKRAKRMRAGGETQRVYRAFENLEQFSSMVDAAVGNLVQSIRSEKPITDRGAHRALSNIPIAVPRHFFGRDADLAAIKAALNSGGRAALIALHGLRGLGKTTLAAAYAERHRADYRATWWIRAETESTMRADLVGLGVQLGWVAAEEKEEPALAVALERLRDEGNGILLVYDNANNAAEIKPYMPRGGAAHIIVTSLAPNWSEVATAVEIGRWPKEVGADYLVARVGRLAERDAALALSVALDGLPLAHEQAAAYCVRTGVSLADYGKRFDAEPTKFLDAEQDASPNYHYRRTVARTFALAIDEAAKLHPAAEPLIVYVALLAPEPIPLFLFSEAQKEFDEAFASALSGNGLDDATAALRAFALIDRESTVDERDPSITTDCIRLHRLVRQIAAVRHHPDAQSGMRRHLFEAMAAVYPRDTDRDPQAWPRARRLDAIALALIDESSVFPERAESAAIYVLNQLALYRQFALADYATARQLFERALVLSEKALGTDHPAVATSLNNLGHLLQAQGDLAGARPLYERALSLRERALGPDHRETALSLNNLGSLLQAQGDLAGARAYDERALMIDEKTLGPDHPDTARSLGNLGSLLQAQGNLDEARAYYERALNIQEKVLDSDHPDISISLSNLGSLLQARGDRVEARPYYERALMIQEKVFGPDHPTTARSLNNLGHLMQAQGDFAGARPYYQRALDIFEKSLGTGHPSTQTVAENMSGLLDQLKMRDEAAALRKKFGLSK